MVITIKLLIECLEPFIISESDTLLVITRSDTHHLAASVCSYPQYMNGAGEGGKPYFIPLRALMVGGAPNLLAAGKLMVRSASQTHNTAGHSINHVETRSL